MFVQPFIIHTTKTHTTFTLNTETTDDWENSKWTVPVNFQISQILKIGKQPISIQIGGKYYADTPLRTRLGSAFELHAPFPNRQAPRTHPEGQLREVSITRFKASCDAVVKLRVPNCNRSSSCLDSVGPKSNSRLP